MKKTLAILTGLFIVFMLAACNQKAEPVNESVTNNENTEAAEKPEVVEKPSELTLEEVLEKSTEASNDLKSFSVKMNMDQDIASDVEEMNMKTKSEIEMNVITEPMAFYQKMTMHLGDTGESIEAESYFTEDGMFFFDSTSQQWMKFPQEMTDVFMQMSGQQTNPGDELKKLQKFVDDFTFEQDSNNYILKLKASGEKFNDFIKETAAETLPPEMAAEEFLNSMNINGVEYKFLIDKESFYPVALDMTMDMEISIEGETIRLNQKMSGQYSNHNDVETISVPQDIIDSAVEIAM